MKFTPALLVLPLLGLVHAASAPAERPQDGDVTKGRNVFHDRCSSCHFIPDTSIRRDKLWVQMINTTA